MQCRSAWGPWAVELLQCIAVLPGGSGQPNSCNALPHCLRGSGQWNSCIAPPHYLGAVGSGTPAMQCPTAWGQWAVELLQYTAFLPGGSGQWKLLQCTALLPGGSGQWISCNTLPHSSGAVGSGSPASHRLTTWGQWAAELLQRTASPSEGQWPA